jgi:carboxypeptidase C (cathepsin A)
VYENDFTFITVHGSGHMVPEDKPAQAHQMIYNWINKQPLGPPSNSTAEAFIQ